MEVNLALENTKKSINRQIRFLYNDPEKCEEFLAKIESYCHLKRKLNQINALHQEVQRVSGKDG